MSTNINIREFNRLYGNLNELHRRVFDEEKEYPRVLCAKWFVRELMTILNTDDLRQMLTQEQVDNIIENSISLLRARIFDNEYKQAIVLGIKELRKFKASFETQQTISM